MFSDSNHVQNIDYEKDDNLIYNEEMIGIRRLMTAVGKNTSLHIDDYVLQNP